MKGITVFILAIFLLVSGCAGTTSTQTIPVGCEKAIAYQVPGFIPGGPIAIRVAAATACSISTGAGHPEVKLAVAAAMPVAYKAVMAGDLVGALNGLLTQLKVPKVAVYATPVIVAIDELAQAGIIKGGGQLTDCDKNIFGSLFKNVGLDAGADLAAFN